MKKFNLIVHDIRDFFRNHIGNISAHTLGLLTIVLAHFSIIPTLLSVLVGKTDRLPSIDLVLFIWASLIALFFKSLIEKNNLYITVIAIGFVAQSVIMGLILFR